MEERKQQEDKEIDTRCAWCGSKHNYILRRLKARRCRTCGKDSPVKID